MQVLASRTLPSTKKLATILKKEFSDKYSYEQFGHGAAKSILVRKSFFVGAQITMDGSTFTIDAIPPSVSASFIAMTLQIFANLFIVFALMPYRKLEKEIGTFLNKRYNS